MVGMVQLQFLLNYVFETMGVVYDLGVSTHFGQKKSHKKSQ